MPDQQGSASARRPAWRARGVRAWTAAGDGLRMYRGTALLLGATATLALAAVLPIASLVTRQAGQLVSRLTLGSVRGGDLGLAWTTTRLAPADTQAQGLDFFFTLLLVSAGATLAVAGISLLSLFGARAMAREGEVAVRRAVGASRRSLIAAALLEGLLLGAGVALVGGALGLIGAMVAARGWPGALHSGSITPALLAVGAVVLVILLGALLPVVFARRTRIAEAETAVFALFWPALLQLALSLIVLTSGALLTRHAAQESRASAPRRDPVLELEAPGQPAERAAAYGALLTRLGRHPELGTASLTSPGVITGLGTVALITTDCGDCAEGNLRLRWRTPRAVHQFVSADSFKALGIPVIAGRVLSNGDSLGAAKVAVVSRSLARDHFQYGEPLGRSLKTGDDPDDWYTVIGIVDDVPATGLGGARQPKYAVYLSILQHPTTAADLLLRAPDAGAGAATEARRLAEPRLRVMATATERDLLAREEAPLGWFGRGLRFQGWSMLAIAAIGLLAVMRIWVRSAYPEFGMRRAVGARHRHIAMLVLLEAIAVALGGLGLGLWFGPSLWSSLPDLVQGLTPWDPGAVAPYAIALVAVTLLGAAEPLWAASRTTPHALLGSTGE